MASEESSPELGGLPPIWVPLLRVTNFHPTYNGAFCDTIHNLYYAPGNLRAPVRHYIAIMAASRYHCSFLLDLHEREFDRNGGDPKWKKGITYVEEKKLLLLDQANRVLAHQPWLCNADLIAMLVRNSGGLGDGGSFWSLCDLATAVTILTHTHSLCSLINALGSIYPLEYSRKELENVMERFNDSHKGKENTQRKSENFYVEWRRCGLLRTKAAIQRKKRISHLFPEDQLDDTLPADIDETNGSDSPDRNADSPQFSTEPSFAYVDFAARTDTAKTFKIHEFGWDHGYCLMLDLANDITTCMDKKLSLTQELTYKFMGGYDNVDTSAYRTAIWNYIEALFGIRHDDYDYALVNQLLSREMKTFVKTCACFPHRITDKMRAVVMTEFKPSEKIHVMLMIMEARLQSSLLYFTRALTNHYAQNTKMSVHPKPLD